MGESRTCCWGPFTAVQDPAAAPRRSPFPPPAPVPQFPSPWVCPNAHLKPAALPTTGVFHLCMRAQLDSELVFEISNNLITFINSILLRLSQSY